MSELAFRYEGAPGGLAAAMSARDDLPKPLASLLTSEVKAVADRTTRLLVVVSGVENDANTDGAARELNVLVRFT